MALLSEAFAAHYLTDMFSAGHARVPRYALLHAIYQDRQVIAHLLSNFLHNHEGRLGVYLTNEAQQVWYAYGDAQLLAEGLALGVYDARAVPVQPWLNGNDSLGLVGLQATVRPDDQMLPRYLAAGLVFVSFADVLRHMARGNSLDTSVSGGPESQGLLGYVLKRLPFAGGISPAVRDDLLARFGPVRLMSMSERLAQAELSELYTTFRDVNSLLKSRAGFPPWAEYETADFKWRLWEQYLQPTHVSEWARLQSSHLRHHLDVGLGTFLSEVPRLISGTQTAPSTLVENFQPDDVALPDSWKAVMPRALITALTTELGGTWGVDA
jgi:hypothetical protein